MFLHSSLRFTLSTLLILLNFTYFPTHAQLITHSTISSYKQIYQFGHFGGDIGAFVKTVRGVAAFDGSSIIDQLAAGAKSGAAGADAPPMCDKVLYGYLGYGSLAHNPMCQQELRTLVCGLESLLKAIKGKGSCAPNDTVCQLKIQSVIQSFNWTAQVMDSMGTGPAGSLEGNQLWYGTYRECNEIPLWLPNNDNIRYSPRYCTVKYRTPASRTKAFANKCVKTYYYPDLKYVTAGEPGCVEYENLMETKVATCLPAACHENDVAIIVRHISKTLKSNSMCLGDEQFVECVYEEDIFDSPGAIAMIVILVFLFILLSAGTAYDIHYMHQLRRKLKKGQVSIPGSRHLQNRKHEANGSVCNSIVSLSAAVKLTERDHYDQLGLVPKILLSFSVSRNCGRLLSPKVPVGHIPIFNGLRVLTNWWLILADSYFLIIPYVGNLASLQRLPYDLGFELIDNASVGADTFFLISGTMVSYLWFKEIGETKGKKLLSPKFWLWHYLHRILRITPVYMVILALTVLFPYLANGPEWNTSPVANGTSFDLSTCASSWWTNLLYINNIVNVDTPCLGWTWYLANEMQFYLFAPIFMLLLWFFPTIGLVLTLFGIGGSCLFTGLLISENSYPPTLMFSLNPVFTSTAADYYKWVYVKPYTRCAPYLIGILLGWLMYRSRNGIRLNKCFVFTGWLASTVLCVGVLFSPYALFTGLKVISYPTVGLYGGIHRALWSIGVSIVIFYTAHGFGGWVRNILTWRIWVGLSRMSYVAYIVHPLVIGAYYMQTHRPFHLDLWIMLYYFCGHVGLTYLTAFVICVAVERPCLELIHLLYPTQRDSDKDASNVYYYGCGKEEKHRLQGAAERALNRLNSQQGS